MTAMRLNISLIPIAIGIVTLGLFIATQLSYTNGVLGAPLDDAWIHFQFAHNLSHGNGFSFNPNSPTPGSTAPLWTILLALPAYFTRDLMLTALLLSAFFFLWTIKATFDFATVLAGISPVIPSGTRNLKILRNAQDDSGRGALNSDVFRDLQIPKHPTATGNALFPILTATLVALTGRMVWASWSGMEATAFTALSLLAIIDYTKRGMRSYNVVLIGLASQLRPEAHALFALAGILWFIEAMRDNVPIRAVMQRAALFLGIYALIAAPYTLFSLSTTGKPLPNTFYAKSSDGFSFSFRTLRETLALHFWDNPLLFVLIPFGLYPLWQQSRIALLWLVGLPLFNAIIVEQVWHHGRYTLPLVPLQVIAGTLGLLWLTKWLIPKRSLFTVHCLLFTALLLSGVLQLGRWANMLAINTQEILDVDVAIGRWLAENTPLDTVIAVDDIGAIGYLSQREIFDLNGLVSPQVWPVLRGEPFGLGRNQEMLRLLSQVRPDYVAIFPTWHFELAANEAVLEPIAQFTTDSHTILYNPEAFIYIPDWPYFPDSLPAVATNALFDEAIALDGYTLTQTENQLTLTLFWRSVSAVEKDYDIFIHVSGSDGQPVTQTDGQPLNFLAPTSRWRVGDTLRDERTIALEGVPTGNYQLNIGIYDRATFARLPLSDGTDMLTLQGVEVP